MEDIKKGDLIEKSSNRELYEVTKEPNESGYLEIQNETCKRNGLDYGFDVIHKNEIDGEYLKKVK